MPFQIDPFKPLRIDPLKYLADPLGAQDPFSAVNKQLRAIGLDPISLDPVSRQPRVQTKLPSERVDVGTASAHMPSDDLTPEQEEGALKKAGGGLLSGLEWVGRKLDSVLGARAVRGVLGGNLREALSFGPLGLVSDELGLTDKTDIVGGRELLENVGILGENKPGFDAGDVTGFAAEVLLDPSTYFFGMGLGAKGVQAATKTGKTLAKVNVLDDVLDLAKTTKGAQSLGLPEKMGARQAGMHLSVNKLLDAEAAGALDDILGMPGLRPKPSVYAGGLGQPTRQSSLMTLLSETGEDIARLNLDEALTSPAHVGLPKFLARGPLSSMLRRPMNLAPGGKAEAWARIMDKTGDAVRWSAPGRQLARAFNPRLRRTLSGERVPATRVGQEAALNEFRFMERTAQQVHRNSYEYGQKWVASSHFDVQKIIDDVDTPAYQAINTVEDAEKMIQQNFDYLNSHLEGYQMLDNGTMQIPEWHSDILDRLAKNYGSRIDDLDRKIDGYNTMLNALEVGGPGVRASKKSIQDGIDVAVKAGDKAAVTRMKSSWNSIDGQQKKVVEARNELMARKAVDAEVLAGAKAGDADAIGAAIDHTQNWSQKQWQMRGGVHNRATPDLPDHLKEMGSDLAGIAQRNRDAMEYSTRRGVDIAQLMDNYALHSPRKLFRVPETTKRGVRDAASRNASHANYGTGHQIRRAEELRDWFGGTTFLNRLSRKDIYAGRLLPTMGRAERNDMIDMIANQLVRGELDEMRLAGGESTRALRDMGLLKPDGTFIGGAVRHSDVRKLAEFLGDLDGRLLDIGASAFEQNPILAMMSYHVDVVRAGHAVEAATTMMAQHADVIGDIGDAVMVSGGRRALSVSEMARGWNSKSKTGGIPPALHFQIIKKLSQQNPNWDNMYGVATAKKPFKNLSEDVIERIQREDIDSLLDEFRPLAGEAEHPIFGEIRTILDEISLPKDLGEDVSRYVMAFVDPDSMSDFIGAWDTMTDVLKTSFTTPWPAFHFRNFMSGQINNYFIGAYDPNHWGPRKWYQPVLDARTLLRGKTIKGIAEQVPMFRGGRNIPDWFKGNPDDYVSEWLRAQSRASDLIGPQHTREHLHALTEQGGQYDLLRGRFYDEVTGTRPLGQRLRDIRRGRDPHEGIYERQAATDPLRGPSERLPDPIASTAQPRGTRLGRAVEGAREVGHEVEGYNRLAPVIAFMKQGYAFDEAVKKVKLAQVDYSMLTTVEKRVFRRIIPFYTFTRRQIPFVLDRLADPSSAMSQAVRGVTRVKREMEDVENPTPEWIATNLSIPIPGGTGGQQRYLMAGGMLGGMEDVFSLLKPGRTALSGTRRTLSGIGSRMHPAMQVPVELATGQSLFLQRPLEETKPATARLIGGLTGAEEVPSFPGHITESVLSRLPGFGRGVSTIRSLTDPRKPVVTEDGISLLNLAARLLPSTTGIRISEVNMDRIRDRVMQEAIEEHLRTNPSLRTFKHVYIPADKIAGLDDDSRALYMLYKKISSRAAKAARARKKEESRASAYSM